MTAKQLKFYQLFYAFARVDISDDKAQNKAIKNFIDNDFAQGLDIWEFVVIENESNFLDKKLCNTCCDKMFTLFYSKGVLKTIKAIADNVVIRRAIYQYSDLKVDDDQYNILLNLLLTNKTDNAEEIFKCIVKNTTLGDGYGKYMKVLLERIFLELLKKSAGQKIEMSRKLSSLLLTYITKIKTDERAMLEQRIKEII